MKEFTLEELIAQCEHDLGRSLKAIDRLTLRPTKHSTEHIKSWGYMRDVCLGLIENLQDLQELKRTDV